MATGGRPSKREAIINGARRVFGRDGYARAGIDTIAEEAGVSTRTIYNHFEDKAGLFKALILESAALVRDKQIAEIERHIGKIEDLRADLHALGLAFASTQSTFPDHFALVRHIHADAANLPEGVLVEWKTAGPHAVHEALTSALASLRDRELLSFDDPHRAANQFVALVSTEVNNQTLGGADKPDPEFVDAVVSAGVETFLRAFQNPSQP